MKCSLTKRQTDQRGFTLSEIMVGLGIGGVAATIGISLLISMMQLSTQNVVTNLSNFRARQTIDHLVQAVHFAQEAPVLITKTGAAASGSQADGILIKRHLGGPYVFKNSTGSTGDIASSASTFIVEYKPSVGLAAPEVGDYFLVNLSTQPELQVASVVSAGSSGGIHKSKITTTTPLNTTAKPSNYTVSATRYRKQAYIFAASGSRWQLLHYPKVTAGMNYSTAANYRVISSGFTKLNNQAFFSATTEGSTKAFWLRTVARSSNHAEYAERRSTALSMMPVNVKLWNYNTPPPQS